jgi:hypothetical protein
MRGRYLVRNFSSLETVSCSLRPLYIILCIKLSQRLKEEAQLIGKRAIVIARCQEQDEDKLGLKAQYELRMVRFSMSLV